MVLKSKVLCVSMYQKSEKWRDYYRNYSIMVWVARLSLGIIKGGDDEVHFLLSCSVGSDWLRLDVG